MLEADIFVRLDYVLLKNGSWLLLRHIYVVLLLSVIVVLVILAGLMCLAFNRNFADCFWPEVWEACSLDLGYKCQVVRWMLAQSNTPLQFEGPLGLLADFEGGNLAVILLVGFIFFSFLCIMFSATGPQAAHMYHSIRVSMFNYSLGTLSNLCWIPSKNEEMLF